MAFVCPHAKVSSVSTVCRSRLPIETLLALTTLHGGVEKAFLEVMFSEQRMLACIFHYSNNVHV